MTQDTLSKDAGVPQSNRGTTKVEFPNDASGDVIDAHVVLLINYVRKHHVASYQELAKRVRKLTILISVPMEPDRDWDAEWSDLDVRVQKNWMITTKWRHSAGFKEDNFIHIPVDTVSQLRKLKPDIIFSYEMGMRTILSGLFRRFHRRVPLVMVGNMSQHIEQERGWMRRTARSAIRRLADFFTYNGPSCKRYLESLGIKPEKMFHVPYCIDDATVFQGKREQTPDDQPRRLFYSGSLSERKGLLPFIEALSRWCQQHPERNVVFQLAGSGPLQETLYEFELDNLKVECLGNLDPPGLAKANGQADICVMPTFADEWALTPIEGLASGIPVLGSFYAQSVESVVKEDVNGWIFVPDDVQSMEVAIGKAMSLSAGELFAMTDACRNSVAHISATSTAERFCDSIRAILPNV